MRGRSRETDELTFTSTFTVGRDEECQVHLLDEGVARAHLQVVFDGILWWARDLNTEAGSFLGGNRIQLLALPERAEIELGRGGPVLSLAIRSDEAKAPPVSDRVEGEPQSKGRFTSETQIIERYVRPRGDAPAGRETLMLRRAFARVQKRSSRRYRLVLGAVLAALLVAAALLAYEAMKLKALRGTAERIFYTAKSLEVETSKLEELAAEHGEQKSLEQIRADRTKLVEMEQEYESFVKDLGVYRKVPEDEQLILRVARIFGECDVKVPASFVAEVRRFVERWKSSDRLSRLLARARQHGYPAAIAATLARANLPPQFLYLALQESGFDERAVGPASSYGFAKGMWQFIAVTADRYGLKVGPRFNEAIYDPLDERFDFEKSTAAAVRYMKHLSATEAQGSGLLVMASYNWGEDKLRNVITALPADPRERNFWLLLERNKLPRETYDYVLSIFSAAVICEDPRLFGMDLACPVLTSAKPAKR